MKPNEIADLARCAFEREIERLKKDPIVQKIVEEAVAAAGCGGQSAEEIEALKAEVEEKAATIAEQEATIAEKEARIAELEEKIAELEAPKPEAPKRGRPPKADK